jgi:hypothetical protein
MCLDGVFLGVREGREGEEETHGGWMYGCVLAGAQKREEAR